MQIKIFVDVIWETIKLSIDKVKLCLVEFQNFDRALSILIGVTSL